MTNHAAAELTWRRQAEFSTLAGRLKSDLTRWRSIELAALIAGAILETAAIQFASGSSAQRSLALLGAVVLALVPLIRATKLPASAVLNWTRLRSASEAMKSEMYKYLTAVGDYRDAAQRLARLQARTAEIDQQVEDLGALLAAVEPQERAVPEQMSMSDYLADRVDGQVDRYYHPQAKRNSVQLFRMRRIEWVLAVAAVIFGVFAAFGPSALAGWVGAITTTAGALAAHREASRVERQAISYYATAKRLEALRAHWTAELEEGPLPPSDEDELVAACEGAISVENQGWMAVWTDAATLSQ